MEAIIIIAEDFSFKPPYFEENGVGYDITIKDIWFNNPYRRIGAAEIFLNTIRRYTKGSIS